MIRFLQKDNRLVKALFVVIIAAASVSMVIYLIPGLSGAGAASGDTYAVVYPHWYSRFLSAGLTVSSQKVEEMARRQMQLQRYGDNPMILAFMKQRIGQQLIQEAILKAEAAKLGIVVTDDDVREYLRSGPPSGLLFPGGKYIGDDNYARLVAERLDTSVKEFEADVKRDLLIRRVKALVASGVTVGDQEVRELYRKTNVKIKFDYAVISAEDLRTKINPVDGELEAFFKKNAARYATAVPEERKISYFAFTPNELPGGVPQPSQQEVQQYYSAHQAEYATPEQARARHILIKAGADAKADAEAKAKAEGLLKQIQGGANFADLAKKNSDDPGSKIKGGELGFASRGQMVPEFDAALFSQKIGETKLVKSQFGYHIIQVEERQAAHTQSIEEVLPAIKVTLIRQKVAQTQENYARTLAAEAAKNGLQQTANTHKLQLFTTASLTRQTIIANLPDSSSMLAKAFEAKQGGPAQFAPTGEGFAIFQVVGVTPAHAPNFVDWKSHVLDDFRAEKLPELLAQKTIELANNAKNMNDLAKAAKEAGATVKSSDLVGLSGQVPDLGAVGQVAPQLFDLNSGAISGPINAGRTGVVARLTDKQQPSSDDIAKNFDQTRAQLLSQRQDEAFNVFASNVISSYQKAKRVQMNAKAQETGLPTE